MLRLKRKGRGREGAGEREREREWEREIGTQGGRERQGGEREWEAGRAVKRKERIVRERGVPRQEERESWRKGETKSDRQRVAVRRRGHKSGHAAIGHWRGRQLEQQQLPLVAPEGECSAHCSGGSGATPGTRHSAADHCIHLPWTSVSACLCVRASACVHTCVCLHLLVREQVRVCALPRMSVACDGSPVLEPLHPSQSHSPSRLCLQAEATATAMGMAMEGAGEAAAWDWMSVVLTARKQGTRGWKKNAALHQTP